MHFFIDETGSFSGWGKVNSLSLLGALIVPDGRLTSLERGYAKLRRSLPQHNGEVKGRLLNEGQVKAVVELLFHHSVIFEASAIDMGMHSEAGVSAFQARAAEGITAQLTSDHPEWMQAEAWEWRRQYEALSLPLVVQTELTFRLVKRLLDHGTMYFSQRRPEELGHFHWVIDAKGDQGTPTAWERWWSEFILPWLQNETLHEPFMMLPIGDYSHMGRFEGHLSPFWRELSGLSDGNAPAINHGKLLTESLRFSKQIEPGLEMVDIVTNATRRALVGNLDRQGWSRIPSLMINIRAPHYIQLLALGEKSPTKNERPYIKALREFSRGGRIMLLNERTKWPEDILKPRGTKGSSSKA